MSKGNSGHFNGTYGYKKFYGYSHGPVSGIDFNPAGSSSVKNVDTVVNYDDVHKLPEEGPPNSVGKNYKNGKLNSERYYDDTGKAYLDIDYSNHGNSKTHSVVPHEHKIWYDDKGNMHRDSEDGIK